MQDALQLENQSRHSEKLTKLHYLLQNSLQATPTAQLTPLEKAVTEQNVKGFSKNFSLFLELIKKPVNLLFSIDQFLFEFSKKTYQQKKAGEFFQQLKERKKLSLFYGHLTRKQITNLLEKAKKRKGSFSKNMLCLLEQRLDVVLFRSGMVETIAEARQLIKHKKILVNQTPITSSSYLLEPGDTVSILPEFALEMTKKLGASFSNSKKLEKQNQGDKRSFIYQDFYKKLKATLRTTRSRSNFKKLENQNSVLLNEKNLKSKFLCNFLIQLLCTQMKSRSFLNLKKKSQETPCLTTLKWKFSSGVDLSFLKKNQEPRSNFSKLEHKSASSEKQEAVYVSGGSLQKKPIFWKSWFNHFKQHPFGALKKNQKVRSTFSKTETKSKNLEQTSKWNHFSLKLFRKSFLLFLKNLNFSGKFSGLVFSQLTKFLLKKNLSGSPLRISKMNQNGRYKPIHFEVSYKLFELVYLYSPQRIQYPFSLDLDLIKRSLR